MNLRDLQYLVAVAEYLHFGKAAEQCHVSQPTLSMQIRKMEDYLGVQLLERSNKQVLLTSVGSDIARVAKRILDDAEHIRGIARISKDPLAGELRLGAFPTLAPYLFPRIMLPIKKALPKLELLLIEEKTDRLIEQLEAGEIDCAFLALPVQQDKLLYREIFEEPFLLAVSSSHPLAQRKLVSLDDIKQENILLLDEGHCLRAQSLELCQMIGVGEAKSYRATSLETLRNMVLIGRGITFMPRLAAQTMEGLDYIPFAAPVPGRKIGLFWRKTSARSAIFETMATLVSTIAEK